MIALIYFLLLSSSWAADLGECQRAVTSRQTQDHTDGLIALFEDLLERQILDVAQLNRLAESLEKNKIINPFTEIETWTKSSALIHYHAIQKYLDLGRLDNSKLLSWALTTLNKIGEIHQERDQISTKTAEDIYYKMKFNPVPAGEFEMNDRGRKTQTTLTNRTEMMSTPVTQYMWATVMGKNPSFFVNGVDSVSVKIGENLIKMQPDHPVEQITWWSAVEYANRLSDSRGYKRAYDLSNVIFKPGTSAEEGNLTAIGGEFKVNAPNEDIYEAEGYRLPTAAEVQFVQKAAGKNIGFHFPVKNAFDYVWFFENSEDRTHPVGQLKPLKIGKHKFYDIPGSVFIWTHDSFNSEPTEYPPLQATNPQGDFGVHINRKVMGGSFEKHLDTLKPNAFPHIVDASKISKQYGLRLVRTLPK